MAHGGPSEHDERILRALILLTNRAERRFSEEFEPADSELDVELPNDGTLGANEWDGLVRSRLPRP